MMDYGGGFGMFFGPLIFIGFIVLIVYLIGGGLNRSGGSGVVPGHKSPLDILNERLARGEIDESEYNARRRILEQG